MGQGTGRCCKKSSLYPNPYLRHLNPCDFCAGPLEGETKPIEATMVKPLVVSSLSEILEERSHGDELVIKSVGYGDFRPVFRKVSTDMTSFYIADSSGHGWVGGNKAKQSQDA